MEREVNDPAAEARRAERPPFESLETSRRGPLGGGGRPQQGDKEEQRPGTERS